MTPSSYEAIPDFGLLYDSVPLYAARKDIGFYVAEATATRGAVLELGCGTGRILLPIARAGRTVVGLDASAQMLARCRDKLAAEPEQVRARVALHEGDARDFDLGAQYALVIAPFRIVQHLTTIEDQLRFLAAVRRHLAPGGRFVFDVFNPNFTALTRADGVEHEDTPEQPLLDGRVLRRAARVARVRWLDQVSEIELVYYLSGQRYVQAFDMRWYLHAELRHLLARASFRVRETYGDFARSPLVDDSPEQVVCAEVEGVRTP
ncbi:MAG TPA: class I SAM-dependent methyltransferase [Gemmatimonadales bacterium]|jgi:SAM-dependent methyltransferase|nr:class I SAM-dependent methyltransferase [Gemmatimonadales bacterium]